MAVDVKILTMSHTKDNSRLLHNGFHLETVLQFSGHGLLTENVVALFGKGEHDLEVHLVLDTNKHGIGKTLAHGLDRFGGCLVQLLPRVEDQGPVDGVGLRKVLARLGPWLCDGYDLALGRLLQSVHCIVLATLSASYYGLGVL